jgi:hypothetical protein
MIPWRRSVQIPALREFRIPHIRKFGNTPGPSAGDQYGWQLSVAMLVYRLRGLYRDRVVLELTPAPTT